MKKLFLYPVIPMMLLLTASSCKRILEIPASKNQIESNVVFTDSAVATSALLGAYYTLGTPSSAAYVRFKYLSLYADEYSYTSSVPNLLEYAQGKLLTDNTQNAGLWNTLYSTVYQCNAILDGVERSTGLSPKAKKLISAEARFLRAFSYFYLVNLYESVPLITSTQVQQSAVAPQVSPAAVYDQMVMDLISAREDLGTNYQGAGKVRANRFAASALLSRIYLFQQRWVDAEAEASLVIKSGNYLPLPACEDTFLSGSREAILQFWSANGFVIDATAVLPASSSTLPTHPLTSALYQSFIVGDKRREKWISINTLTTAGVSRSYPYPAKYKNRVANTARSEAVMALRLGEQYLIRAEALAQLDRLAEAVTDINVIRARAGLLGLTVDLNKQSVLDAVMTERRLELFGEWGHRLLDLKRTGKLDEIMGAVKPTWLANVSGRFPIPKSEITYNQNLLQNYGY